METLFSLKHHQYIAQMTKIIKYENGENESRIYTKGKLDSIQFVYEMCLCNLSNINTLNVDLGPQFKSNKTTVTILKSNAVRSMTKWNMLFHGTQNEKNKMESVLASWVCTLCLTCV